MKFRKKLIEVALPLDAINVASAKEKSIRHGHPSTLHLWWARRPLAAARAVIFGQMVDDPSSHPELFPTEEEQDDERRRLFRLIEQLVEWENTTNESVLTKARDEIWRNWKATCAENQDHPHSTQLFDPEKLPIFHDPFAGGGALPLEAQRLGLDAYASDLNPVAVLINKATIQIPPLFANRPPINPRSREQHTMAHKTWRGAQGLAEDVRYYGNRMRSEAEKRIGRLYPKVDITEEMTQERPDLKPLVGSKLTVIAWLWARTVKSPNPAFAHADVPLASSFMLCTKPGSEAYVEPVITGDRYRFVVRMGKPPDVAMNGTKLARGANFRCLLSNTPMSQDYVRAEFRAKRNGDCLMAIVAEGEGSRIYLSPTEEMVQLAKSAHPTWKPEEDMNQDTPNLVSGRGYGIKFWHELFTDRQLVALTTFWDLVVETHDLVKHDAFAAGFAPDTRGLQNGGSGDTAYADAIALYLAFCVDKGTLTNTTQATWQRDPDRLTQAFARQALPMTWDYAEANPLSDAGGGLAITAIAVAKVLERLPTQATPAHVIQADATSETDMFRQFDMNTSAAIVSTDPPYYDNIGYADLSDYFYVWIRRPLKSIFPQLFETVTVPKQTELVASPHRHATKQQAESFFVNGMTRAMHRLAERSHPAFPVTVYYAFKQSETESNGTASTGWETFLEAVIRAGFAITGTWPMRTELIGNLKKNVGALASSIILVCRARGIDAPACTRSEFANALRTELPLALKHLQRSNIAPVDLAQAAIGPGMGIFSRFSRILDSEGKPVSVRQALLLINQTVDEVLAEQEGDFDSDTRWALSWFEQFGFEPGDYGTAETLSKAKNTSVQWMKEAGILDKKMPGSKVRLLRPGELSSDWDPSNVPQLTVWEMTHHLIRVLESAGEIETARVFAKIGSKAEAARELAYRLYSISERKKRAENALSYNGLVHSWPEILRLAHDGTLHEPQQAGMFA